MKILLTNDDGVFAEGLRILKETFESLGEVYVVAPDRERTAISHALTLDRPLRLRKVAERTYAVDGTPVDCIHLALSCVMPERPSLVVSGINSGPNMGEEVVYSGTVSAAFEATFLGLPSMAVSLAARQGHRYEAAAQIALKVAKEILCRGLPRRVFLNVNVPNLGQGDIKGLKVTKLGRRVFGDCVVERVDPRGNRYYWIGGADAGYEAIEGTDYSAVASGYVSVTPLKADLTAYEELETFKGWGFE